MSRRLIATVIAVLSTIVAAGGAMATSASAAPTAPYRAVAVRGEVQFAEDATTATFTTSGTAERVVVDVEVDGQWVGQVDLAALAGSLTPGTLTLGYPGGGEDASLIAADSRGSCYVSGSLTLRAFDVDSASGAVTALDGDFSGDCGSQPVTGLIRYDVTTDYAFVKGPTGLTWDSPYMGQSVPKVVTLTAYGSQSSVVSSVRITSPTTPANFVIRYGTDQCTGATLAPDATCTVTLDQAWRGAAAGEFTASLDVATSTGVASIPLRLATPRPSAKGSFHAVSGRVMDTRSGLGVRKGAVGRGQTVTLSLAGKQGLPTSKMSAVVLNLTVTGPTAESYVTAYAGGTSRPTTSNINFRAGWTGANLVTVPVSSTGQVTFYNHAGSTQLVADVAGWYDSTHAGVQGIGGSYLTGTPSRLFDSRTDWGAKLPSLSYFGLPFSYGSELDARIRGVVVTLTSANATASGFLSAVPNEPSSVPETSSVNYTRGVVSANLVAVPTTMIQAEDGSYYPGFWIANKGGSTDVVVDIVGIYTSDDPYAVDGPRYGTRFRAMTPTRIVDTRSDLGVPTVGTRVDTQVQAPTTVAGWDTWALVGNATGVKPTSNGYLTFWDEGPRPNASSVSLRGGVTTATATWATLAIGNTFLVWNNWGTTETLYDVSGQFNQWPPTLHTSSGTPDSSTGVASTRQAEGDRGTPATGRLTAPTGKAGPARTL